MSATQHTALLLANGNLDNGEAVKQLLVQLPPNVLIIAVDGGIQHCYALGLTPHLLVGDLDSVSEVDLARAVRDHTEINRFPTHKDETDLELALLAAAERGCKVIRILGAAGDRLDQTLANIYLLDLPALHGRDVRLVNGKQTMWLWHAGQHDFLGDTGDTISLLPISPEVTNIYTQHLEYPLRNETLRLGPARGVSNIMLNPQIAISFSSGLLLVVHTIGRA